MRFGKRLRRGAAVVFQKAHDITHKGPIGKLHDAIAKKIPAPFSVFVKIGTASSDEIHKLMTKAHILKPEDGKNGHRAANDVRAAARRAVEKAAAKGDVNAVEALKALRVVDSAQANTEGLRVTVAEQAFRVFKD